MVVIVAVIAAAASAHAAPVASARDAMTSFHHSALFTVALKYLNGTKVRGSNDESFLQKALLSRVHLKHDATRYQVSQQKEIVVIDGQQLVLPGDNRESPFFLARKDLFSLSTTSFNVRVSMQTPGGRLVLFVLLRRRFAGGSNTGCP